MNLADAQKDMRLGYFAGATGLFASGAVWLAACAVAVADGAQAGVYALLLGGMAIHPVAVVLSKALGRPGRHSAGNPLAALALESTGLLLLMLLVTFVLSRYRLDLFFPATLLVIGGRYLLFQTLYGLRMYWLCGGLLAAAGIGAAMLRLPAPAAAALGGLIEIAFGLAVFLQARRAG